MNRDELSLLLYFESCAVDYGGRVNQLRMNAQDFEIAEKWNEDGFIEFGRIKIADHNRDGGYWVRMTESAWTAAHVERRDRAARMLIQKRYRRTKDKEPA